MSEPLAARAPRGNLLSKLPQASGFEHFENLFEAAGLRIERIVSFDHETPEGVWYDQPQDEWVMVVVGEADIEFDDHSVHTLRAGDWITLHAHVRHRVARTAATTVWLAVHHEPTLG